MGHIVGMCLALKGVVYFFKKTFADNLLTPMSSKILCLSFFSREEIKVFDENLPAFFSI